MPVSLVNVGPVIPQPPTYSSELSGNIPNPSQRYHMDGGRPGNLPCATFVPL